MMMACVGHCLIDVHEPCHHLYVQRPKIERVVEEQLPNVGCVKVLDRISAAQDLTPAPIIIGPILVGQ